jgi:hypothetical protein
MKRLLTATASPSNDRCDVEPKLMSPTLSAFRAVRAYTWPSLALTPSVAPWCPSGPSTSRHSSRRHTE